MRVLLTIHHALDPNAGAPGVTLQLAGALHELGHHAEILSWGDMPESLGPRSRELLFAGFVARRAARATVDVVDASTGDAWLWGRMRRSSSPALVTRTHGLEHTYRDARRDYAEHSASPIPLRERLYHHGVKVWEATASMRAADAVVFLNDADRNRAVHELHVAAERAHVLPNGMPDPFLGLAAPSPLGTAEPVRIAQVGSYDARKGVKEATAALGALLARHDDVAVTFLGTGVDADTVRSVFSPTVRDRVDVVPRYAHAELPSLLHGHAILTLPSLAEGFSLALVEGMACGLAPVATRVGAAPDVIDDGTTGLLVPPADRVALESALERLHSDRELLERLRRAAHAAVQRYSWREVAALTAALYEQVVDRRIDA